LSQSKRHLRRVGGAVVTTFAAVLVLFALVLPDQIFRLPPHNPWGNALVRIPIEALVAIAVLLALPERARRILATVLGLTLGLLTIVKIIDMGFFAVLAREFDPVLDWILFVDGYHFLEDSIGKAGAFGAAAGAVLLSAAILVFMTLSVRRLSRVLAEHARPTRHVVFGFSSAWIILAVFGVQIVGGIPVAAQSAAELARDTALKVPQDIADQKAFDREVQIDAFRNLPDAQLLTALRGKDVIIGFVESYGRSAVEDPSFNSPVLDQLRADDGKLKAAGFASRTGFLTSPTFGGGSWLAHSTFLSGLWINTQQRYNTLVASNRLTLTQTFGKAGWRKVGFEPGNSMPWPEASFYGYDKVYDERNIGYHGPHFSWSNMPDQFALQQFAKFEYAVPNRGPLLGEVTLTSSHTPWAPLPKYLDWNQLGDGSVYGGPTGSNGTTPERVWKESAQVRQAYAQSIQYSLQSLISFVEKYGNKNLVLVFLGDHQPAPIVTGPNASHDVPVTIVSGDPAALDKAASWGWQDGLKPDAQAPVWKMDSFRDRFLTTFGSPRH
jgi:hypothetical protein